MKLGHLLSLFCLGLLLIAPTWAHEEPKDTCPHPPGWNPWRDELQRILSDHLRWLDTRPDIGSASKNPEGRANLCNADLRGGEFSKAPLRLAKLNHADLQGAKLNGAWLAQAELTRANLSEAELRDANLREAEMESAELRDAQLTSADLILANLKGAFLFKAVLNHAYLDAANLNSADLELAKLNNAKLGQAELSGARLFQAELNGALRRRLASRASFSAASATTSATSLRTCAIPRSTTTAAVMPLRSKRPSPASHPPTTGRLSGSRRSKPLQQSK